MDEAEVIPYYLRPEKATRQASVVVLLIAGVTAMVATWRRREKEGAAARERERDRIIIVQNSIHFNEKH